MSTDLDVFVHGKNMGSEQMGERGLCQKHGFSAYLWHQFWWHNVNSFDHNFYKATALVYMMHYYTHVFTSKLSL